MPTEYPIAITIADIVSPSGNVISAFSVWSTSPPKTSSPPNANIANVKKDKILRGVWYAGFGEVVKSLIIFNIGCLNWNLFNIKILFSALQLKMIEKSIIIKVD